jgi:hypothetical protein
MARLLRANLHGYFYGCRAAAADDPGRRRRDRQRHFCSACARGGFGIARRAIDALSSLALEVAARA